MILCPHDESSDAIRLVCSTEALRVHLEAMVDPQGHWPFRPSRWEVEELQGKYGIRGIVGHDTLRRFGWRSVDERITDLGLPPWNYLTLSVGMRMRTTWKDSFVTDVPMFNVPKTHGKPGENHQKCMYPPGIFWLLDERLRATHDRVVAAVQRRFGLVENIEAAWATMQKTPHDADVAAARKHYAVQRKLDRARLREWVIAARTEGA